MEKELSIFIDESGDAGPGSDYYLLTLVFHDQSVSIDSSIFRYSQTICSAGLTPRTFHFTPIIRGHKPYENEGFQARKKRFATFRVFAEQTEYSYATFIYVKREIIDADALEEKMQRDLCSLINDHLAFFQSFNRVKIYYDNGQQIVSRAVHSAINQSISKEAIIYRDASPTAYHLFQVADYICGLELTALRYKNSKAGGTEERFLGEWINFKRNYMKKIRRKRLN